MKVLPQFITRSRRYLFRAALLAVLIGMFVTPALINAGSGTFSNTGAISVPNTISPATPYPSDIGVSGLSGVVTGVTVTISNMNHQRPDDFDILLVGPNNTGGLASVLLMSDAGGSPDVAGVTLTFQDGAQAIPDNADDATALPITTGTYRPTDYDDPPGGANDGADESFTGLPANVNPPYGTTLSVFNLANPNTTWSLYVFDDRSNTTGNITGGWSITITTNDAPVAVNDSAVTNENSPVNINVLANDTDAEGNTLTPALVANATNGNAVLNPDKTFTYTPNAGYSGGDSFTYKVNDGFSDSNTATVNITVNAVNVAPVANGDDYNTTSGSTLNVGAPGVLSNDNDGDSDPLTAVPGTGPANGSLTLNADGGFSYTPNSGFVGDDSFTYMANDGTTNSGAATVTIHVVAGNAAPSVSAGADQSGTTGVAVNVAATYSDPNVGDTHTATIDWGDGTIDTPAAAGGAVNGSHTYAAAGSYTIIVTVTDNSGAPGNDSLLATITDPAVPTSTPAPTATDAPFVQPTATTLPLLTDFNGVNVDDSMRADVPLEIRYGIFARMIVHDGRYVRRTNAGMIGHQGLLDLDVRHAVDISTVPGVNMSAGVRLCFDGDGTVFFLDAAGAPRVPVQLNSFSEDGRTCVFIFSPGTVVVTRNGVEPETAAVAGTLEDCEITTVYRLNLRAEPSLDANVLTIIPDGVTLAGLDNTSGWFRVNYLDNDGWLAAEFVNTSGDCAAS
jgi:hypothetical protein